MKRLGYQRCSALTALFLVSLLASCSKPAPPGAIPVADSAAVAGPTDDWPPADVAVAIRATWSSQEIALLAPVTLTLDVVVADSVTNADDWDPEVPRGFRGTRRPASIEPSLWGAHRGLWRRFVFDLVPLNLGRLEVPPFTIDAKGSEDAGTSEPSEQPPLASTAPFALSVQSVIDPPVADPEDAALGDASASIDFDPAATEAVEPPRIDPASVLDAEVEPPADPFAPPFRWLLWLGVLGLVLLLCVAAWLFVKQHRKLKPARVIPPEPADLVAMRQLEELRDAPRATPAEVESFYVRLSDVLRTYIEGRFGLRAPERTTEEFLAEAEATPYLQSDQRETLRRFLAQCDLVKFAGMQPPSHVDDETFTIAEEFVRSTRAKTSNESPAAAAFALTSLAAPQVSGGGGESLGIAAEGGWSVFWPFDREDFDLLDPWFLGAIPVVLAVCVYSLVRRRAAVEFADPLTIGMERGVPLPTTPRVMLRWLPLVLLTLAFVVLSYALARPVFRELVPLQSEGVNILLVLDTSSSMKTRDMDRRGKLRIVAAREQALAFAESRPTDRVGLLTFARFPELRCPLTLDEESLRRFLLTVDTVPEGSALDGTAIGVALAAAVDAVAAGEAESKVIVLLTDGSNNRGEIEPTDAAKLAKDSGIRVHTIGLGGGAQGLFGMMPTDFSSLAKIAKITDGRFFEATSEAALANVYEEIDRMEKVELEDPRYRTADAYGLPLLLGLALLGLGYLLEFLWIREAP